MLHSPLKGKTFALDAACVGSSEIRYKIVGPETIFLTPKTLRDQCVSCYLAVVAAWLLSHHAIEFWLMATIAGEEANTFALSFCRLPFFRLPENGGKPLWKGALS
jgi:hypothetical protein